MLKLWDRCLDVAEDAVMLSVVALALLCLLVRYAHGAPPQAPRPPQAPVIQEVITPMDKDRPATPRCSPKEKKPSCGCSAGCTCGCNEGEPCVCAASGTTKIIPRHETLRPTLSAPARQVPPTISRQMMAPAQNPAWFYQPPAPYVPTTYYQPAPMPYRPASPAAWTQPQPRYAAPRGRGSSC